jgi:hypothetical protein
MKLSISSTTTTTTILRLLLLLIQPTAADISIGTPCSGYSLSVCQDDVNNAGCLFVVHHELCVVTNLNSDCSTACSFVYPAGAYWYYFKAIP